MITSIELKGFQSHAHTKIDFTDEVNILVGPSRNGKTAVLRAIRWVTENRPIGIDGFITHGKKEISVTLELDGHTIVRKKNSRENIYILDGEKFAGIGSNVPATIAQLLNLSDLNVSSQFDQPYLLFDSPGQVAQQLNAVVNLSSIDSALANIASMKRQNDQDIRVQEARVAELEALEATFPDLVAAEEFIEELENQQRECREKEQKKGFLLAIQNDLRQLQTGLQRVCLPEGLEEKALSLYDKSTHVRQLIYTKDLLLGIQTKLSQARLESNRLSNVTQHETKVSQLLAQSRSLEDRQKTLGRLRTYNTTMAIQRERFDGVVAIIKVEEAKFKKLMPDICPLCGK